MGNISAVIVKRSRTSTGLMTIVDLTFSASYATNGDVLPSNAALGLEQSLDAIIANDTSGGYMSVVDHANRKIKLFRQTAATSALVEIPNATDVHLETCRVIVHGDMPNK